MLDACHSAGFGEGKKLAKLGLKPATDDVARDLTDDDYGVAVMCAAMAHEKAEGKDGHGLFTQASWRRWRRSRRPCRSIGTTSASTCIICSRLCSMK